MPLSRISLALLGAGAAILVLFCLAFQARGATVSTTFAVKATVLASCQVTAANLDFGNYTAGSGADTTADSNIDVTCTNGTTYTVALDGGSVAHDVSARRMSDGNSHTLSYALYTTASFTTAWGDGSGATTTVSGTGNGSAQSSTVFGQLPAGQYVPSGAYTDHVTVTVTY